MVNTENFRPTIEVYGVDPKVLADMTYRDACILKYIHVKDMFKDATDKSFSLEQNNDNYEELVRLDVEAKKHEKAIKLLELQLSEIGVDANKEYRKAIDERTRDK
jgi:hypothetical protein